MSERGAFLRGNVSRNSGISLSDTTTLVWPRLIRPYSDRAACLLRPILGPISSNARPCSRSFISLTLSSFVHLFLLSLPLVFVGSFSSEASITYLSHSLYLLLTWSSQLHIMMKMHREGEAPVELPTMRFAGRLTRPRLCPFSEQSGYGIEHLIADLLSYHAAYFCVKTESISRL